MKKQLTFLLISLYITLSLGAQDQKIYSKTMDNPYNQGTATLELWGEPGNAVQEYINYVFYAGSPDEVNVLRIKADNPVKVVWILSEVSGNLPLREVYKSLTGRDEYSLTSTPLSVRASVSFQNETKTLEAGSSVQRQEFLLSFSQDKVVWGDFEYSFGVQEILDWDLTHSEALKSPFGNPLATKKIQIQWIKGDIPTLQVEPLQKEFNTLKTTVTSPVGRSLALPGWRTINVWEEGESLPSSEVSLEAVQEIYGSRSEVVRWAYQEGKLYQLQVVDLWGNSQSVWFPFNGLGE